MRAHDDSARPNPEYRHTVRTLEERRRRLAIARAATWIELAIGAIAVPLALFIWIAAPRYRGLPGSPPPIEVIGLVGIVIGFLWMVRIRLAESESGAPPWRYRSNACD